MLHTAPVSVPLIVFDVKYKLCLHSVYVLLGLSILLRIMFSKTLNPCSSFRARIQLLRHVRDYWILTAYFVVLDKLVLPLGSANETEVFS
jgi:hypothetical protein